MQTALDHPWIRQAMSHAVEGKAGPQENSSSQFNIQLNSTGCEQMFELNSLSEVAEAQMRENSPPVHSPQIRVFH
jgi:hypothetical protein